MVALFLVFGTYLVVYAFPGKAEHQRRVDVESVDGRLPSEVDGDGPFGLRIGIGVARLGLVAVDDAAHKLLGGAVGIVLVLAAVEGEAAKIGQLVVGLVVGLQLQTTLLVGRQVGQVVAHFIVVSLKLGQADTCGSDLGRDGLEQGVAAIDVIDLQLGGTGHGATQGLWTALGRGEREQQLAILVYRTALEQLQTVLTTVGREAHLVGDGTAGQVILLQRHQRVLLAAIHDDLLLVMQSAEVLAADGEVGIVDVAHNGHHLGGTPLLFDDVRQGVGGSTVFQHHREEGVASSWRQYLDIGWVAVGDDLVNLATLVPTVVAHRGTARNLVAVQVNLHHIHTCRADVIAVGLLQLDI